MKKGIIITVVLVVIAIILAIVFVNLFKEPDTTEMSNRVVSTVQDGYLNDEKEEGEFETINSYLDKVLATGDELTTAYRNEVQNFKTTYLNYTVIAEFYSKQIIFTEYNDAYRNNKSDVMNGLNNAQNRVNSMVNYINTNSSTFEGNAYWTARSWDDVRDYVVDIIDQTNRAFRGLQNIYSGCITSQVANNDFATLVLSTINTELANVLEHMSESVNDTVGTMVNAYLTGTYQDIMTYIYDSTLQEKVKDIMEKNQESTYYFALLNGTICD